MVTYLKSMENLLKTLIDSLKSTTKDARYRCVVAASIFFGGASYIYFMTNNIHNYDSIIQVPSGVGASVTSGRWLIRFFDKQFYNSTVVNTGIALFLLMLSCLLLVSVLELRSKIACVAITAVTVCFPSIAVAMVFNYTVHIYCFAIFLGTLGVWLGKKKNIFCFILGGLSIACCLGGYQAYYAYVAVLLLLILIRNVMTEDKDWKNILLLAIKYFILLVLGYLLYTLILNHYLNKEQLTLTTYMGIENMGKVDIGQLPSLLKKIYVNLGVITHANYMSVSITGVIQKCICLLYFGIIAMVVGWALKSQDLLKIVEIIVLLSIFPIAADAIEIMAPVAWKYSLVGFGMVGVFYLPIVMADNLKLKWDFIGNCAASITSIIVLCVSLNYCYVTNANYTSLHYILEVTENYYIVLYSNIISTAGYTADKEIVLVGSSFQNMPEYKWDMGELGYSGTGFHVNISPKKLIMELYLGQTYRGITGEEKIKYQTIIDNMEVYPNDHAIQVVDNLVLVKISE